MTNDFEIRPMTPDEVALAASWAAEEGWNPGLSDVPCFLTVDPAGFIGGFLDGEMIASISVINYDDAFSFLGFYIVLPEHRGKGHGYALWQAAIQHAGDRLIGLDGVVDQQDNYKKSGFRLAYRNIRYGGVPIGLPDAVPGIEVRPVGSLSPEIEALDRTHFPAPRTAFLEAWISAPGHVACAAYQGDNLAGFGVVRPCGTGHKVGPLLAQDRPAAEALLSALAQGRDEVFLDTPEPNRDAVSLAEGVGLKPVFETARMYTGPAPEIELSRIFGVTTFELG